MGELLLSYGDMFNEDDWDDLVSFNNDECFNIGCDSPPCTAEDDWNRQVALAKKRRVRKKKEEDPLVQLRILKSDIRRSYAGMLTNVLNSYDYSLIFGFLSTFLSPDGIQTTVCQFGPHSESILVERKHGVSDIFKFWCSNLPMIPDSTMQLKNTTVTVPKNGSGSKVMSCFTLTATSIYDIPFPSAPEVSVAESKSDSSGVCSSLIKSVVGNVTDSLEKLSLRENPLKIVSEGSFVLTLDDEKRIKLIEMMIFNNWNGPSSNV